MARRLPAVLAIVVVLGVVVVGASALFSSGSDTGKASSAEIRLDGSQPARGSQARVVKPAGDAPQPKVVQVVPPGGGPKTDESAGEDEPPLRVRKENAELRRQLSDLKALEAARRRVARQLAKAGAIFDGPVQLGAGGLAWPLSGPVISPFGQRWGRLHAGIDIVARTGTVIHAAADGGVVIRGVVGGYGNYVCVQHNRRLTTCYAHLSRFLTERGDVVQQGEPIGLVGCTGRCFGEHLHFETWVGGKPVDPMPFL